MSQTSLQQYKNIALVLQGGGALGSYQGGVISGLVQAGIYPNWVAGVSIGALNCAILAGNDPKDWEQKLSDFWNTICSPASLLGQFFIQSASFFNQEEDALKSLHNSVAGSLLSTFSASESVMMGQRGFFRPRPFPPGSGNPSEISYYDTKPMIETLEKFCDFDRINSNNKRLRVSIEATNIRTGNFIFFDNTQIKLTPLHFLASSALPPGFPAVEIDGEYYWDGGCVSNTPLSYILDHRPRQDTLIFQVDLWSAKGALPKTIFEVLERIKDIRYSSRTRWNTSEVMELEKLRKLIEDIVDRIPDQIKTKDPWFSEQIAAIKEVAKFNCIQLIYRKKPIESHFKDYQFSKETMLLHWNEGLSDIQKTLQTKHFFEHPKDGQNFISHDIHNLTNIQD